jgi:hypothetical protein
MSIEKSLESLGLTQIEALAYTYLVANPSSSGYRVSRGSGNRPRTSTARSRASREKARCYRTAGRLPPSAHSLPMISSRASRTTS